MSQISISRLRKIIADADVAFAASRQAMEDIRTARAVLRSLETKHGQRTSWGTYVPLKNWNQLVEVRGKEAPRYPEAYEDYTKAHAVLAEAEAAHARQQDITHYVSGIRNRAFEFVRDSQIELPVDLKRKVAL